MANQYTDQQIAEALARLELNGGNVKRTAIELGLPRTTLIRWRDETDEALRTLPDTQKRDYGVLWGQAQVVAVAKAVEMVPDMPHTPDGLRAVAQLAGISSDKFLDYALGRKGATQTLNVDARSQSFTLHIDGAMERAEQGGQGC